VGGARPSSSHSSKTITRRRFTAGVAAGRARRAERRWSSPIPPPPGAILPPPSVGPRGGSRRCASPGAQWTVVTKLVGAGAYGMVAAPPKTEGRGNPCEGSPTQRRGGLMRVIEQESKRPPKRDGAPPAGGRGTGGGERRGQRPGGLRDGELRAPLPAFRAPRAPTRARRSELTKVRFKMLRKTGVWASCGAVPFRRLNDEAAELLDRLSRPASSGLGRASAHWQGQNWRRAVRELEPARLRGAGGSSLRSAVSAMVDGPSRAQRPPLLPALRQGGRVERGHPRCASYSSMNYATGPALRPRPPAPTLRIRSRSTSPSDPLIGGLGGWPWVLKTRWSRLRAAAIPKAHIRTRSPHCAESS